MVNKSVATSTLNHEWMKIEIFAMMWTQDGDESGFANETKYWVSYCRLVGHTFIIEIEYFAVIPVFVRSKDGPN